MWKKKNIYRDAERAEVLGGLMEARAGGLDVYVTDSGGWVKTGVGIQLPPGANGVDAIPYLLAERQLARHRKEWVRADLLRDKATSRARDAGSHLEIKDMSDGVIWLFLEPW